MNRNRVNALAFLVVLCPAITLATAPRTFVASTGMDTNPCSRVAPCRSFTAALAQTTSGGSIIVVDSAGYGPVNIGQSVSLIAPPGVYAGITVTFGVAIGINGTSATDVIVLRGLSIEGLGGFSGILTGTGASLKTLQVQNCFISGFSEWGIDFEPSNMGASLFVEDTSIAACDVGIFSGKGDPAANPRASISYCRVERGNYGIWLDDTTGTIRNSVVDGNANRAFRARASSQITIENCQASNNLFGVGSEDTAVVRVANSTITNNTIGVDSTSGNTPGLILTRISGDPMNPVKTNTLENNGINGTFTGTFTAQ